MIVASWKESKEGVFITTGRFSDDAVKDVENIDSEVILIGGRTLAELIVDRAVGTTSTEEV